MASSGPGFVGIGMQKAGTRWLHDQLQSHPELWLPLAKELHFFDRGFEPPNLLLGLRRLGRALSDEEKADEHDRALWREWLTTQRSVALWRSGGSPVSVDALRVYRRMFPADQRLIAGEITPAYSGLTKGQVAAICEGLPRTRFVLLVRHPADRLESALGMAQRRRAAVGDDGGPLLQRDTDAVRAYLAEPGVQRRSFPSRTVPVWQAAAGRRLLVESFDAIRTEPDRTRRRIASFIGVQDLDAFAIAPSYNRKAGAQKHPLSPEVAELIEETFAEEVQWCRDHLAFAADW